MNNHLVIILAGTLFIGGCDSDIQTSIPGNYTLSYGEVVYVFNDGRCAENEIIKITGGHRERNIQRIYECISHPERE